MFDSQEASISTEGGISGAVDSLQRNVARFQQLESVSTETSGLSKEKLKNFLVKLEALEITGFFASVWYTWAGFESKPEVYSIEPEQAEAMITSGGVSAAVLFALFAATDLFRRSVR